MGKWGLIAVGLGAIALGVLVSTVSFDSAFSGPRARTDAASPRQPGTASQRPAPPSAAPISDTPPTPAAPRPGGPEPREQQALLPPPTAGTWEATPIVGRARALGQVGAGLEEQLAELQPKLSACFTRQAQSTYAGRSASQLDRPEVDDTGSAVVVLQLEAGADEVRVVDAPVEIRASASDATLACVQQHLRGLRVPLDGAKATAARFRYRLSVTP